MSVLKQKGFTIVELLIVIVVIAILVAITIVAYNGIQDRATDSTVKGDLTSFAKKIELAKVDASDNAYSFTLTQAMGITATKSQYKTDRYNWYYCVPPDRHSYALGVVSSKNKGYFISSVSGLQENQSVDSTATCAKVGTTTGTSGVYYVVGHSYVAPTSTWSVWANG